MKVWEKNIKKVMPYVPGEQPKLENIIKLNTNENPYPPTEEVRKLVDTYNTEQLRLYPDTDATILVDSLAKFYNMNPNQIFVGTGSDDVLAMIFMTFFNSEKPIFFPNITYSFYPVWAQLYRIPYECKPLNEDFKIVPSDYYQENGGVIFPNPNAPTGEYLPLDSIEDIIKHNQDTIVVIDEAYIDFGGKSAIEFVNKYENVIVVQTFSKSRSLAGIRIGYAFGNKELIKALNDVKFSFNSYTINRITNEVGAAAVKDTKYFEESVQRIIDTREKSKERFRKAGFTFPDSMANFIFVKHKEKKASYIFEELKKRNIFVRHFNQPLIDNYLRVTIGTDEQMDKVFEALDEIL